MAWRDSTTGENPWSGIRSLTVAPRVSTFRHTTREKDVIHPPSSMSTAAMVRENLMNNDLVCHAGEVDGSGNAFFHDCSFSGESKATSAKRICRVRGSHDLETRQQLSIASLASCRKS